MTTNVEDTLFIGPYGYSPDASSQPQRGGRDGGAMIQVLHGDYVEQVMRGNSYHGSNPAAQAVSVALATTYTGLCLSNDPGSTKDLIVNIVGLALTVAPAAIASLHLIGGYSQTAVVHTTPVTPDNAYAGSSNLASGKLDSAATIPTPKYKMSLQHGFTAAALPNQSMPPLDLKGAVVLGPGGFIAIGALTAVTGIFSFMWEEVPHQTY